MPSAILRLQERIANADGPPRRQAIHGRLAAHLPLYRLGRYRPPRTPGPISSEPGPAGSAALRGADADSPRTPQPPSLDLTRSGTHEPDDRGSGAPTIDGNPRRSPPARTRPAERGEPGREPVLEPIELPDVAWISRRDGTRAVGDLEDRDARYPHPATS